MNINNLFNFFSNLSQAGRNFLRQRALPQNLLQQHAQPEGSLSSPPEDISASLTISPDVPSGTIGEIAIETLNMEDISASLTPPLAVPTETIEETLNMEEDSIPEMTQEKLEEALNKWNPQTGDVEEAKKRILEAFKNQSSKLNLSQLQLADLPKEICYLKELKVLDLMNNRLTSLPNEIGNLQNLEQLHLEYNLLTSLPNEIGNLKKLDMLLLLGNQITKIPTTIGSLESLTMLDIGRNPIESLPKELGDLENLIFLYCQHITISDESMEAFLAEAPPRLKRSIVMQKAITLQERIASWYAKAQTEEHLNISDLTGKKKYTLKGDLYISHLTEKEKFILLEWLRRLEETQDFQSRPFYFANLVLEILETGLPNKEFKEFFFPQAEANNACCGDRAAMALNEVYTHWYNSIKTLELSDTKEQLEAFIGVAKTGLLRKKLAQLIKENSPNEQESVEIYLYYENLWKEELGLISASEGMLYSLIGERTAWMTKKREEIKEIQEQEGVQEQEEIKEIQEQEGVQEQEEIKGIEKQKEIKEFVLNNFIQELYDQSSFIKWFLEKAPQNKSEWDKIEEDAHEEVAVLMEKKEEIENGEPPFKKRKLEEGTISIPQEKLEKGTSSKEELDCQMYQVMQGIKIKRAEIIHNWIKSILKNA